MCPSAVSTSMKWLTSRDVPSSAKPLSMNENVKKLTSPIHTASLVSGSKMAASTSPGG